MSTDTNKKIEFKFDSKFAILLKIFVKLNEKGLNVETTVSIEREKLCSVRGLVLEIGLEFYYRFVNFCKQTASNFKNLNGVILFSSKNFLRSNLILPCAT